MVACRPVMREVSAAWSVVLGFLLGTLPAGAANIRVHPGDSIQAAVDHASPGDHILVYPGTYHEAGTPCPTDPSHQCGVVVTCLVTSCTPAPPPGYDPAPNDDRFEHNTVTGNGLSPDPTYGFLAADLIHVPGPGATGDCWSNNTFGTAFGTPLPACP